MQNKKCNVCLEIKPLTEFYIRMGKYRVDGTFKYHARTKCKHCDNAKRTEWNNNNRKHK